LVHPKLRILTNRIQDKKLRNKVVELLENPTFETGGRKFSGLPLETSPAGLSHHHYYPGGYMEHVVSTANIAAALCDSVERFYHGKVNRDLVIAGILLHDIFKPVTYTVDDEGRYVSTRLADYLDHLSLVVSELVRRDFPLDLVHVVAAHMGSYGPVRPRTVEALVCHLADLTDSRLNGEVMDAAAYLTRRALGQELPNLTSKEAFEIVHSKTVEGWEGLTKTAERIKRSRSAQKT
jgi:7,8-dihydroneopterin 2',3'-cyclic phosphate phosphodiesterase